MAIYHLLTWQILQDPKKKKKRQNNLILHKNHRFPPLHECKLLSIQLVASALTEYGFHNEQKKQRGTSRADESPCVYILMAPYCVLVLPVCVCVCLCVNCNPKPVATAAT